MKNQMPTSTKSFIGISAYLVDCIASGGVCWGLAIVSEGFRFGVDSSWRDPKDGAVSKLDVTGYRVVGVTSWWNVVPFDTSKDDGPGLSNAVSVVKSSDWGKVAIDIEKRSPSENNNDKWSYWNYWRNI